MVTYHPSYILRNPTQPDQAADLGGPAPGDGAGRACRYPRSNGAISWNDDLDRIRPILFCRLPLRRPALGGARPTTVLRLRGPALQRQACSLPRPYSPGPSQVPEAAAPAHLRPVPRHPLRPDRVAVAPRPRCRSSSSSSIPGFIFDHTVQIPEIDRPRASRSRSRAALRLRARTMSARSPRTMGFAGFRILYPLNKPGDELGAFLGASYFRFLCPRAVYGLSARGLAINTAEPGRRGISRLSRSSGWRSRPPTRGRSRFTPSSTARALRAPTGSSSPRARDGDPGPRGPLPPADPGSSGSRR